MHRHTSLLVSSFMSPVFHSIFLPSHSPHTLFTPRCSSLNFQPLSMKSQFASKSKGLVFQPQGKEEKLAALEKIVKQLESNYGKGTVHKLGAVPVDRSVEVVSTGSIALDAALGVGGLAKNRITEIYGPESSGKTTLALHVIANVQKNGGMATFIDVEHALDPAHAARLGVDVENLFVCQPDSGEQALEVCDSLVRSGSMDVIVVDSVAALVTRAELDGDMGDQTIASQARLMSQACRKLTASLSRSGTVLIFINQIRMKIGVLFGSPETTSGGVALKFYSSQRLEVRRIGSVKKGDEFTGNMIKVKVAKNKLAPPFRTVTLELDFKAGLSKYAELIDLGVKLGIVEKSGAWLSYKDVKLGQGREKSKVFLEENPQTSEEIERQVREMVFGKDDSTIPAFLSVEDSDESDSSLSEPNEFNEI